MSITSGDSAGERVRCWSVNGWTTGQSVPQLPAADDPKAGIRGFLPAQRNRIDGKRLQAGCGEPLAQHRHDGLTPFRGKPAGQCHVEAKLFHDVGVTPALQIIALPRCQLRRISSRTIVLGQRSAK
jgi:hypothetical protein